MDKHNMNLEDLCNITDEGINRFMHQFLDASSSQAIPTYISDYMGDWNQTMVVHREMSGKIFSVRSRYYSFLGLQVSRLPNGEMAAWPDAMKFLTPRRILTAALQTFGPEPTPDRIGSNKTTQILRAMSLAGDGTGNVEMSIGEYNVLSEIANREALDGIETDRDVDMKNLGADLACDMFLKIIETGEHKGVFGGEKMEKVAQFILSHTKSNNATAGS